MTVRRLDTRVPFVAAQRGDNGLYVIHRDRARQLAKFAIGAALGVLVILCSGLIILPANPSWDNTALIVTGMILGPTMSYVFVRLRRGTVTRLVLHEDEAEQSLRCVGVLRGRKLDRHVAYDSLRVQIQPIDVLDSHDKDVVWKGWIVRLVGPDELDIDLAVTESEEECAVVGHEVGGDRIQVVFDDAVVRGRGV